MNIPYGYIYRIRNKINGKTYVGQRKLSLDKRWRQYMGSGVAVKAAIAKHGPDAFVKELLAYAFSYEELNKIEVKLILQERNSGKAQYNLHLGSPVPQNSGGFKNLTPEESKAVYADLGGKTKIRHRRKYEETVNPLREDITSLYVQYRNCKRVADQLKISTHYVNRFLKESGIELNHQNVEGRVLNDEIKKRISNGLNKSSVTFQAICSNCDSPFESKSSKRKYCEDCFPKNYYRKRDSPVEKIILHCQQCNTEFEQATSNKAKFCSHRCSTEANRKLLPPIEMIEKLYWEEKMSANQIGSRYSVSGQTIRNYMRKHGVMRREERHQAK